ncbi:hypothetical protein FOA52_005894 [Chlamydomonas sp. UWO 241]|nr:hypothetical protein FOA52_005894 [Chlamydomonas sp. UWO 241]
MCAVCKVLAKAAQLAASLKPYYINFEKLTRGQMYYQSVYLLCAKDPDTMAVGAAAREAFGITTAPYMPHHSLMYSDMTDEERDAVVAESSKRLYSPADGGCGGDDSGTHLLAENGFAVNSLCVWYLPEEDKTCASWTQIAEFPLGGK